MVFSNKKHASKTTVQYLGIHLSSEMNWKVHEDNPRSKFSHRFNEQKWQRIKLLNCYIANFHSLLTFSQVCVPAAEINLLVLWGLEWSESCRSYFKQQKYLPYQMFIF